jgi:hypothetical protein
MGAGGAAPGLKTAGGKRDDRIGRDYAGTGFG